MEKLRQRSGIIFCGLFIYLIASSFINQDVYAFTVRFASLLIFIVLGVLSLPYLLEDLKNRDIDLIMTLITVVLSVIFVVITGSGYGAALIPSHLAMICYMQKHMVLDMKCIKTVCFAGAVPVILWYSHVRWSYNFNMAGFVFMIMAFFAMILTELVSAEHAGRGGKKEAGAAEDRELAGDSSMRQHEQRNKLQKDMISGAELLAGHRVFFEAVIFITAFILSMLYHSRTVMFGMIMFAVVFAFFRVMSTDENKDGTDRLKEQRSSVAKIKRLALSIVFLLASAGSVFFTLIYIKFAESFGNVTVLYKDVFSGRQGIWKELWGALADSPLTGIGSSYELKSFEIFEVHNGMFDILAVHGIIVFVLIVLLMWRMFNRVYSYPDHGTSIHVEGIESVEGVEGAGDVGEEKDRETESENDDGLHNPRRVSYAPGSLQRGRHIAVSAAFAMMFTSYFENFFTVPPYSIIFMTFVLIAGCRLIET